MITFRTLGKLGRFGNQLFEYAGTRLYAELNGYSSVFPDWVGNRLFAEMNNGYWSTANHMRALALPTIQLADMRSTSWSERVLRPFGHWRRSSIEKLYQDPRDDINLYGYLQDAFSLEMLVKHKAKVLPWFHWQPDIDQAFHEATAKYAPWVGVHIRRGDFVRLKRTLPIDTYLETVRRVAGGRPIYLATDDPTLRDELHGEIFSVDNPLPSVRAHTPGDVFDFWMLKNASAVIAGGSTFAWWAAYLGDKNNYYSPPLTHTWPEGYSPVLTKQTI